jgi:hypothetical protein
MICGMSLSCRDFLDVSDYIDGENRSDTVFTSRQTAESWLWGTAALFPDDAQFYRNPYTPGPFASDESFTPAFRDEYQGMAYVTGEIDPSNIGAASFGRWGELYRIIRQCNIFLTRMNEVPDWQENEKSAMEGYARFYRAFAYYSLLIDFGPPVLIGDEVIDNNRQLADYDRPRCLYDEAVEYICAEFENAADVLPLSQTANFGRPTKGAVYGLIARLRLIHASPMYNGGTAAQQYFGGWRRKIDGKHYIQQEYDDSRWAVAAAAAKRVMEMDRYRLYTVAADIRTYDYGGQNRLPKNVDLGVDPDYYKDYPEGAGGIDHFRSYAEIFNGDGVAATINPEYVWGRYTDELREMCIRSISNQTNDFETNDNNHNCVPQKIIDNFRMADGRSISNSSSEYPYSETGFMAENEPKVFSDYTLNGRTGDYVPAVSNMYNNREMRFYASIGFNGCYYCRTLGRPQILWYYYDSWPDGKSTMTNNTNSYNVTGYVATKYLPRKSVSIDMEKILNKPDAFGIIRYAEILLSYAEALNNLQSQHTVTLGGKTYTVSRDEAEMKLAFNQVRHRAGLPGASPSELGSPAAFRELIQQERMIEFLHENRRYYDVRRWGIYLEEENLPIMGMNINASQDAKYEYYSRTVVTEKNAIRRIADRRMIFLPLPADEIKNLPSLDQNPGWR